MPNIKTITLIHAITTEQSSYGKAWYQDHKDRKKDYNAKYYQQHKDQWKIYNQSNATPTAGRQRDKNVTGTASLDTSRNQFPAGNSALRGREKNVTGTGTVSVGGKNRQLVTALKNALNDYSKTGGLGPGVSSEYYRESIANAKNAEMTRRKYKQAQAHRAHNRQMLDYYSSDNRVLSPSNMVKNLNPLNYKNFSSNFKSGVKDIAKQANSFGSNWKSGAKSIIDKGKSIFNKLFG